MVNKSCPVKSIGWMSRHGGRLTNPDKNGEMTCPKSGWKYRETATGLLECLEQTSE